MNAPSRYLLIGAHDLYFYHANAIGLSSNCLYELFPFYSYFAFAGNLTRTILTYLQALPTVNEASTKAYIYIDILHLKISTLYLHKQSFSTVRQ